MKKVEIKKYTSANKDAWNEVVPRHQVASKEKLDRAFEKAGFIIQSDEELLDIFDKISIKAKNVIHLCCNNGRELLSIKNMGASRCVGVDYLSWRLRKLKSEHLSLI